MKAKMSIFANCFFLSVVLLLSQFTNVQAQTSEEIYSSAVRQLQAEGYAGIDKALQVFEDLIRKDPIFLKGYVSAADAYLLKYEFSEQKDRQWLTRALQHLDTATAKEAQNPVLYFKRAVIYFNLEQPDRAVGDVQRAMDLAPRYLDARLLYLQYLLSLKKIEEARKFVDTSLTSFPDDPAPMKYLADVVLAGGDNEKAVELYQQIIQMVPKAPNTHLALGKAWLNLKEYPRAIVAAQKALDQDPDLADAHFLLSVGYSETGKLNEAISQLEKYNRQVPRDDAALNNLALLYEQSGQKTKARLAWLKLKESSSDKTYKDRAEQHLIQLASGNDNKVAPMEPSPGPPKKGANKNEKSSP